MSQGDNAWRIAREFMVTSTVLEKILRLLIKNESIWVSTNDQHQFLLKDILEFSTITANLSLPEETLAYSNLSENKLNKIKMDT